MTLWADLEALAAEEAGLVADERFDQLPAIYDRRDALAAELGRLDRGRAGVRGYARAYDVQR